MTRKICVFTGTRAEYGLLKPLIDELIAEPEIEVQLLISGMHLSPEFGLTYKDIDTTGCAKVEKVEMLLSSDSSVGISKAMGLGMISYAEALERLKPDLLIGLGDRFELFAVAAAATVLRIPIAHLHGGEATEGAFDEAFRHSITKMSHLHFAATETYRKRIIQLGEHPDHVYNVGAIGLDHLKTMRLLSKQELEKEIGFSINEKTALVTYHPVTLENATAERQFDELLKALDQFEDLKIVFTKPNADTDGRIIIQMIDNYVQQNPGKAISFVSMGQLKYLSAMAQASCVIGNSSSGIVEAPSLKVGTVNIGDRQKGRIKAQSVIDCLPESNQIVASIHTCLNSEFCNKIKKINNPYEISSGRSADRIKSIILSRTWSDLLKKKFFDIDIGQNDH